jgi:hypothetical protein
VRFFQDGEGILGAEKFGVGVEGVGSSGHGVARFLSASIP